MSILTLRFKDSKIQDYALKRGKRLTIGRNSDNDIVIDSLSVSGCHARIESVAANFVVRDLESTNGTFVNNERIELHALQHGDVIIIGKHELVFDQLVFDPSATGDKGKAKTETFFDDKTRFLDTNQQRELTQEKENNTNGGQEDSATDRQNHQAEHSFWQKIKKKLLG